MFLCSERQDLTGSRIREGLRTVKVQDAVGIIYFDHIISKKFLANEAVKPMSRDRFQRIEGEHLCRSVGKPKIAKLDRYSKGVGHLVTSRAAARAQRAVITQPQLKLTSTP